MYITLSARNARASFRNYAIYFLTLVLAIGMFYVFLALPEQDIMRFLRRFEGRAVRTTLTVLKYFAVFMVLAMFFLIRYANSFMLQRRRREIGMYLMLGMHQRHIFLMLFLESLLLGTIAWLIGIGLGIVLSEMLSLFTLRVFDLDVMGHRFKVSLSAIWQTAAAFFLLQVCVNLFQAAKVFRLTPGALLSGQTTDDAAGRRADRMAHTRSTRGAHRLLPLSLMLIGLAYGLGLRFAGLYEAGGPSDLSRGLILLAVAMVLGSLGTMLFFYALGHGFRRIHRIAPNWYYRGLHAFSTRAFTHQLGLRSISVGFVSLLLFLSILLLSFGVLLARGSRGTTTRLEQRAGRPIDLTLYDPAEVVGGDYRMDYVEALEAHELAEAHYTLRSTRIFLTEDEGLVDLLGDDAHDVVPLDLGEMLDTLHAEAGDDDRFAGIMTWFDDLTMYASIHLINGDDMNRGLALRGQTPIDFDRYDVAWYTSLLPRYLPYVKSPEDLEVFETILGSTHLTLGDHTCTVAPVLSDDPLAADDAVSYGAALIVSDPIYEMFRESGRESDYLHVLFPADRLTREGRIALTEDALEVYDAFAQTLRVTTTDPDGMPMITEPFHLSHQVQTIARELILIVSVCYTFIYLGLVFTIMAVSILALQQLTEIRDHGKRYTLLYRLGAQDRDIRRAVTLQTSLYFGAPLLVALIHMIVGTVMLHRMLRGAVTSEEWGSTLAMTMGLLILFYLLYYAYTLTSSQKFLEKVKRHERRDTD